MTSTTSLTGSWSWRRLQLCRTSTGATPPRTARSPPSPPPTPPSHSPSPSRARGPGETPPPVWTPSLWSGTMTMTSVVTWSLLCPELCPLRMKRVRKIKISTSGELLVCQVRKSSSYMLAWKKIKRSGYCTGNPCAEQNHLPSPIRGTYTQMNNWILTWFANIKLALWPLIYPTYTYVLTTRQALYKYWQYTVPFLLKELTL